MNDVSGEVHTIITTRDNMNDNTGTEDNKDVIEKEDKKLINANVSLTILKVLIILYQTNWRNSSFCSLRRCVSIK